MDVTTDEPGQNAVNLSSTSDNRWTMLQRKGIRGGDVGEIIKTRNYSCFHNLLIPNQLGLKDRIGVWSAVTTKYRYLIIKKSMFHLNGFKDY